MGDLLPTVPGYAHGVVGTNPTRVQCDECGAIETPAMLVLMKTRFHKGDGYKARLCEPCRKALGCDCNTCTRR